MISILKIAWFKKMELPLARLPEREIPIVELSDPARELVYELRLKNLDVTGITTNDGVPIGVMFGAPTDNDRKLNKILLQIGLGKHGTVVTQNKFRYCAIIPPDKF